MKYVLDPRPSRFTVQAFAAGALSALAHSPTFAARDFKGEMSFSSETFEDASLLVVVRAASLELTDNVKEADRKEILKTMQEQVLQSAQHPGITYRGTAFVGTRIADNWFRIKIHGNLSLRHVDKPREIDAQLRLLDSGARLSGELALSQAAYGIRPVTALAGMIKLKDVLKLVFDLAWTTENQPPT